MGSLAVVPINMPLCGISCSRAISLLFCHTVICWRIRFVRLYTSLRSFLQSQTHVSPPLKARPGNELAGLTTDDVVVVMKMLGIFDDSETTNSYGESYGELDDTVVKVFEEKEPSFEELKDAFAVFDENGDGFIEPFELQRVLCRLGFKEGSKVEECERMIRMHDEDGDGRMDRKEFVKFMHCSLC